MGGVYMKRTGNCKKCGCIEFRLLPKIGKVQYICAECGELVNTADCGHYTTTNKTCSNCDGSKFKATITKEEGTEYWDTVCAKCGSDISKYYVDKNGEKIDSKAREVLLISDYIQDIKEIIEKLKGEVSSAQQELSYIDIDDSKMDSYLVNCMNDIDKLDKKVKELEEEFWGLKRNTD